MSASDLIDSTTSATERLTSIGNRSSGIGLAVSDEQPVLREDQRKPFLGHPNTVDHPPQLFEAQLADEPARRL